MADQVGTVLLRIWETIFFPDKTVTTGNQTMAGLCWDEVTLYWFICQTSLLSWQFIEWIVAGCRRRGLDEIPGKTDKLGVLSVLYSGGQPFSFLVYSCDFFLSRPGRSFLHLRRTPSSRPSLLHDTHFHTYHILRGNDFWRTSGGEFLLLDSDYLV
jgi:hypothetical protein